MQNDVVLADRASLPKDLVDLTVNSDIERVHILKNLARVLGFAKEEDWPLELYKYLVKEVYFPENFDTEEVSKWWKGYKDILRANIFMITAADDIIDGLSKDGELVDPIDKTKLASGLLKIRIANVLPTGTALDITERWENFLVDLNEDGYEETDLHQDIILADVQRDIEGLLGDLEEIRSGMNYKWYLASVNFRIFIEYRAGKVLIRLSDNNRNDIPTKAFNNEVTKRGIS